MKILLDECVPARLSRSLIRHNVVTAHKLKDIEPHVPALLKTLEPVLEPRVYHIGSLRLA